MSEFTPLDKSFRPLALGAKEALPKKVFCPLIDRLGLFSHHSSLHQQVILNTTSSTITHQTYPYTIAYILWLVFYVYCSTANAQISLFRNALLCGSNAPKIYTFR
jgi:hypothetical protein